MSTNTEHYNLKKPDTTDQVLVVDLNDNMDIVDAQMYENQQAIAEKSTVSASATGTSTTKIGYITIDGAEYALNGGVTSVNEMTGAVVLEIPDKTSDLMNDSGFQTADEVLTIVSGEAFARDQADSLLGGRIDDERNERSSADTALGVRIDSEETARSSGDTALGARIDTEATARSSGDTMLGARIDNLGNTYEVLTNKVTAFTSPTDTQYPSAKLVQDFVNSSINSYAAFYITKNAQSQPFATKAELDNTATLYSGGAVREPTKNDYCIVLADEVNGNGNSTRYIFNNGWEFQYLFNYQFTNDQINALNSGATSAKIGQIATNTGAIATINASAPMQSGITSAKVSTYDAYADEIAGKQAALSTAQMSAVNSGITSDKVNVYEGYASSKQDKVRYGTEDPEIAVTDPQPGDIYIKISEE